MQEQPEAEATIDEICEEACAIAHRWRNSGKIGFESLSREHSAISWSYPIVFKILCFSGEFSERAFRRHVLNIKNATQPAEEEFMKIQGKYLADLYLENSHASRAEYDAQVERFTQMLIDERNEFKREVTAAATEEDQAREIAKKECARETAEYYAKLKAAGTKLTGEIVVVADIKQYSGPQIIIQRSQSQGKPSSPIGV